MKWEKSTAKVLYKKGYVCYYKEDNVWKKAIGITNNKVDTDQTDMEVTTDIITKGVKLLKPGDLLLCTGHGEYYVGDGYKVDYVKSIDDEPDLLKRKKSGIQTITLNETFKSIGGIKAEGTFSWGSVHDEFPVESSSGHRHYFYYDQVAHVFRHCECGNEPNGTHSSSCSLSPLNENYGRQYTIIWRKK